MAYDDFILTIYRPGKHFEYAHQYTVFMIELAQVTNDANTLKILCRKLRKNQPVLLYDKEIYGAAYTAYLEVKKRKKKKVVDTTAEKDAHI